MKLRWLAPMAAATGILLQGCSNAPLRPQSVVTVESSLAPGSNPNAGDPHPGTVAASRDARGVQTDFYEGIALLHPESEQQLQTFLSAYGGTVLRSSAPTTAARNALGLQDWRDPPGSIQYTIKLDLDRVSTDGIAQNARAVKFAEPTQLSSQAALKTFALLLDAKAKGYRVAGDYIERANALPETLFSSPEGLPIPPPPPAPPPAPAPYDAFAEARFGAAMDPANSNVIPAWQFVAAHGIARRVKVAIVDRGYWLNLDGTPASANTDFPNPVEQWDQVGDDNVAAGASNGECSGHRCDWHGTGSAGVAVGLSGNNQGRAGVGGFVSDPFLIKQTGGQGGRNDAIVLALARGADVINISSGGQCNYFCRQFQTESMMSDHVEAGGKTVFVASAGNDNSRVGDPNYYHPCIQAYVICVGMLVNGAKSKDDLSNYGERVDVFAPTNIPVMPSPPQNGPGAVDYREHSGTSAAAPFVAGVVAMMKAINPQLGAVQVAQMLRNTAQPGIGSAPRVVNALAAVRAAAAGIPIVPDRFEGAGGIDVGQASNRIESDLNISASDVDSIRFLSNGPSTAVLSFDFPSDLGKVRLERIEDDPESECPASEFVKLDDPAPAAAYRQTRQYTYQVSGGSHRMVIMADDVNAYDFSFALAPVSVAADAYEDNEHILTAKPFGRSLLGWRETTGEATLQTPTPGRPDPDRDVYLIKGLLQNDFSGGGVGYTITSFPAFQVWGNEAAVKLEVHQRNADGSLGAKLGTLEAGPCSGRRLVMPLKAGDLYYAFITGEPGKYRMSSGGVTSVERLNYFNLENVRTRPGPVEIRNELRFVLAHDPAYRALVVDAPGIHISLRDPRSGDVVAEGRKHLGGERLLLSGLPTGTPQVLQLQRRERAGPVQSITIDWEPARTKRTSGNLLDTGRSSSSRRIAAVPPEWVDPIRNGRVKASFSATLAPHASAADASDPRMVYLDASGRELRASPLSADGEDRAGDRVKTMKVQAESVVPAGTSSIAIELPSPEMDAGGEAGLFQLTLREFHR